MEAEGRQTFAHQYCAVKMGPALCLCGGPETMHQSGHLGLTERTGLYAQENIQTDYFSRAPPADILDCGNQSSLLTMPKPLTVWITINVDNSERDGNTRPPDLPLEKSVCRSGSNS